MDESKRVQREICSTLQVPGRPDSSLRPSRPVRGVIVARWRPKSPVPAESVFRRLDLGALCDKFFVSGDGRVNWERVIEAVSE